VSYVGCKWRAELKSSVNGLLNFRWGSMFVLVIASWQLPVKLQLPLHSPRFPVTPTSRHQRRFNPGHPDLEFHVPFYLIHFESSACRAASSQTRHLHALILSSRCVRTAAFCSPSSRYHVACLLCFRVTMMIGPASLRCS
jgi:hypothetical protein